MKVIKKTRRTMLAPNYKKYGELVHYIVYKQGNFPNFGITLLYKEAYFSDFDFYELFEKSITNEKYRKIEHGPAPCNIKKVLSKLVKEGKIVPISVKYFSYTQKKFIAKELPEIKELNADEIKLVDKVLQRFSTMSAKQISDYSHQDTPWKVTPNKEIIDYELVFYRSDITSVKE